MPVSTTQTDDCLPLPLVPRSARVDRAAIGFDSRTLLRISIMAFDHSWRMGFAIVATILAAIAQIVIPRLIGDAVDNAHGILGGLSSSEISAGGALVITAWWLFIVSFFRGVVTMIQNYQGEAVGHLIAHKLRLEYYAKLQQLSFRYHDQTHTGELMTRGILDIEGVRLWVHTGILRMILLAVLIFGGGAMLISMDASLALVALAFVPLVAVGASLARLKLRSLWYALQEELSVLTRVMEENLGGIRVVRAFAAVGFEMVRFDHISAIARKITQHRIWVFVASTTAMTFAFFLSMGMVLWIGGEHVLEGRISVGEFATFLTFMTILQQPVRQIAWMVNSIARASTCGSRIFEILDLESDIQERKGAVSIPTDANGIIRFEAVSFGYYNDDQEACTLTDISFELAPGKILGIVGPPGSGKSTIANLIPRFYDVTDGRITIAGIDVRDIQLSELRRYVSVVQQDAYLFTSAVDTNIAYGDPWADRSAIRQATETAQLHHYIEQLPDTYRTLVGERGVSLSGGQRQRLAIARSILPESGVIVFDDATAAVDAGTELQIRQSLSQHMRSRATIIVAHRLSSLAHADEILFLDKGRIVERGSHDDLVALGGRYANLLDLQTTVAQDGLSD
ncbi:MAG: ATP-binding cassette subfamily B multidrug efflux pump [Parasphingorhabdus sp.]|jgi:ATP-binding cassette subfamily B multidrug efflux pump